MTPTRMPFIGHFITDVRSFKAVIKTLSQQSPEPIYLVVTSKIWDEIWDAKNRINKRCHWCTFCEVPNQVHVWENEFGEIE